MPYAKTTWVNGSTPANQTNMNNLESQYTEASQSHAPNLYTAYVEAGLVATKDGTIVNQLDVTSGTAWLLQADSTVRRRTPSASTAGQFTTSTINTTYYLFLNNDGTFTWSTTSTGPTNALAICQATTDGSGNILVVTDKRTLATTLLPTLAGTLILPTLSGTVKWGGALGGANKQMLQFLPSDGGDNWGVNYIFSDSSLSYFDATSGKTPLRLFTTGAIQTDSGAIATNGSGAFTKVGNQATAGSFGMPAIVAQTLRQHVTTTGLATLLTYSVATSGIYRISGYASFNNTNSAALTAIVTAFDPDQGSSGQRAFATAYQQTGHPALLDGTITILGGPGVQLEFASIVLAAKISTNITCAYNDPVATPNDWVTFIIERLA